jgi:hypothetical protein
MEVVHQKVIQLEVVFLECEVQKGGLMEAKNPLFHVVVLVGIKGNKYNKIN